MGCSGRQKEADIRPEQKWDFISLNDFKSTSCFATFAYGYLWISLIISCAVYGIDTFTAVNLLAFDRWSGEIKPVISFAISKWIFSACIIASWVNLGFEYIRAMRVMRRGAVAESYLDSLAVRLQCIRMGRSGRGWRRFLVFAELTKSKKGAEYVALLTYFSFQSWIRVIFCQGPRQVVNAVTLYSVFKANLEPTNASNVGSALETFFKNIGVLADQDKQQAIILSGMVFTLVIWTFAALSLLLAIFFYLLFLWHYIPKSDGGLSGYCERKINSRLSKIVSVKVNKAIEEEERKRLRADAKAVKKGEKLAPGRQATLPVLFADGDKLPEMPLLGRNDTTTTLPLYESRPGTPNSGVPAFELSQLEQKRPFPSRNGTSASNISFASNAPLMGNAADVGYGRSGSPAPTLPSMNNNYPNGPQRTMTGLSNASNFSIHQGPQRTMTGVSNNPNFPNAQGPPRMPSAFGDRSHTESPVSYTGNQVPSSIPQQVQNGSMRSDTSSHPYARVGELGGRSTPSGPGPAISIGRRTPFAEMGPGGRDSPSSDYGRDSPTPFQGASDYGRSSPAPRPRSPTSGGYQAYNDSQRSASNASPAPYQNAPPQQYRNMTDPGPRGPPGRDYLAGGGGVPMPSPVRSATGLSGRGTPNGDIARLASPAPYMNNANGRGSPMGPPMNGGYRR